MERQMDELIYELIEQNQGEFPSQRALPNYHRVYSHYGVSSINELRSIFGFPPGTIRAIPVFEIDGEEWIECNKCSLTYPASSEFFVKNPRNTVTGLRHTCKMCRREELRESKQRRGYYDAYKAYKRQQQCAHCGISATTAEPLYGEEWQIILQFDHLSPSEKEFDINQITKNAFREPMDEKLVKELNKGVWMCANCHHMKTYTERDNANSTWSDTETAFRQLYPLKN